MTHNPYSLLMNDPELFSDVTIVNFHNPREQLLTLTQLIERRGSKWAVRCGEALMDTPDRRFLEGTLTDDDIRGELGIPPEPPKARKSSPYRGKDRSGSTGRAIEGMLEFWKVTGMVSA